MSANRDRQNGRPAGGKNTVPSETIVDVPHRPSAELVVIVDLATAETIERMPDVATVRVLGCDISAARIAPFEQSAEIKLLFSIIKNLDPR